MMQAQGDAPTGPGVVILGAGHAGYQAATSLRQEGYAGAITLVDGEGALPYQRPPLSKAYLKGKINLDTLRFRAEQYYHDHRIGYLPAEASAIDRSARQVRLADGRSLSYEHLILATGARNRVPEVPGMELKGVAGLRTLADADALATHLGSARSVVVIGAGFIGLEFAAVAHAAGASVQVLEMADRVMARAVSAPMSAFFGEAFARWGVELLFGSRLARIVGDADGRVSAVETADGRVLPADLVVYGIGVLPNVEMAAAAGLACDNGIRVDAHLATSDPWISAIGDCANFPDVHTGIPVRLESVQNAGDQARCVAARIVGKPAPYSAFPWFWSEQASLRLQIAGVSTGHDQTVTTGDAAAEKISVLCFREGRLIAVESVNSPLDHMTARRVLAAGTGPRIAEAQAEGFGLAAWEKAKKAKDADLEQAAGTESVAGAPPRTQDNPV